MSKHCIHCNGIVENEELSYCESCFNKLRTKGMFSESKKYFCGVCGRELTDGDNIKRKLCNKHYQQIKKYGFTLEDNRRTEIDLNEYEEYPKHFEMKLYDEFQEELEDKVLIDKHHFHYIKVLLYISVFAMLSYFFLLCMPHQVTTVLIVIYFL